MLNKINLSSPQCQQKPAFKGAKEVEMLIDAAKKLPQKSKDITNFGSKLNHWLDEKMVSKTDVKDASKSGILEEWKRKLLAGFAKD